MYGLVIESIVEYIRTVYGEEEWDSVRRLANIDQVSFSTQQKYPESIIPQVCKAASKHLRISESSLMESVGVFFVTFVGRYGYDRVMSVLGRHVRDFLNGLDNLHEYLRFSYPRMTPPSFFCEEEDKNGLKLHYRTRRQGFVYYTMGQIKAVGEHYYNTPIEIEILLQEKQLNTFHVVFQLVFDNSGFDEDNVVVIREGEFMPIAAHVFFDIFPFSIFFDKSLKISVLGSSLQTIMARAVGCNLVDVFSLIRPLIDFSWAAILSRLNNVFELTSVEPTKDPTKENNEVIPFEANDTQEEMKTDKFLKLKGQMLYMEEWEGIIYLGSPVMPDLDSMLDTGLYINDLSMHDFSRDLVLAGTQQSVELKLALDQEQQKSKRLEDSMRKLDEEMKRTDELLYQMIPKQVADRLREGNAAVDTCEVFDTVTILFSDVVTFTEMCSRITPMEVVSLLNAMYSLFDRLTEIHNVYKVETIGDAYMVVAGAPNRIDIHAQQVADMALDMLQVITGLKDPSTNDSIRIRVGMHSGNVVAGVVGIKMPRYCLFGDAVNTASRMESTSEPMKIQISQETKALLPSDVYFFDDRGTVLVKGKGKVQTYWLTGKQDYVVPTLWEEAPAESPHYSPVMVADKILKRDSLAYNTLSPLSTPYPSRPNTGDNAISTGKPSAPSAPPVSLRPPRPPPTPSIQGPRQNSGNPSPIPKTPRASPYKPVPMQQRTIIEQEKTPDKPPLPPTVSIPPPVTRPSSVTLPSTATITTATITTVAPTVTNATMATLATTTLPVTNAVSPLAQNDQAVNKVEVASTPQPLAIPRKTDVLVSPTDTRPQVQQVVPHMHCSVQCQSTSCNLQ